MFTHHRTDFSPEPGADNGGLSAFAVDITSHAWLSSWSSSNRRKTFARHRLANPRPRGDGAFARTREPRTFEDHRPHESGVTPRARTAAVSQTSRSSFAGMTASKILNPA
jgi:hypothetical protein